LIQTAALGSWFKSKGSITVKGLLTSWSNFQGRSKVALTIYRMYPKSDSKLVGKFVGKEHVNGNLCSPDCISISLPNKRT